VAVRRVSVSLCPYRGGVDLMVMHALENPDPRHLRRAAEANGYWIVAREHIRFGDWSTARGFLVKSLLKKPNYLRAAVLVFAFCGGAPKSIQQRFMATRKYEFLQCACDP